MHTATACMLADLIFCTQYARKHRVAEQGEVREGPFLSTFSPNPPPHQLVALGRARRALLRVASTVWVW